MNRAEFLDTVDRARLLKEHLESVAPKMSLEDFAEKWDEYISSDPESKFPGMSPYYYLDEVTRLYDFYMLLVALSQAAEPIQLRKLKQKKGKTPFLRLVKG